MSTNRRFFSQKIMYFLNNFCFFIRFLFQESFLIFSLQNNNFNLIYESKFDTNYTKTWDYNLLRDKNTLITLGPAVDNSTEIHNISIFLKRNIFGKYQN